MAHRSVVLSGNQLVVETVYQSDTESAYQSAVGLEEKLAHQWVVASAAEAVYQSAVASEPQSLVAELDKQSVVASEQR